MRLSLNWWYRISLPRRVPDTTPAERERTRYARLTSAFSLVIFFLGLLTTIYGVLTSINPAAPVIEVIAFVCILASLACNKLGLNLVAALLLILNTTINVVGNLLTNPLDPVYVPILCALVITVVFAGSLMPPFYALLVGLLNSVIIVLLALYQKHTDAYNHWIQIGYGSILIALPIALQIIVGVVTYVILSNLIAALRRADRAEEIIALQKEVVQYQQRRMQEQQQLEEGIAAIAQVYAAVAQGNWEVRVPLHAENILWQVAVPLNNLLNRAQQWKRDSDRLEQTQAAIKRVAYELRQARMHKTPVTFAQPTETPIDALLPEVYFLSRHTFAIRPARPFDTSSSGGD